ncbi:MAG: O-antigen ligase family protein, partial [Microcoleus sp.]
MNVKNRLKLAVKHTVENLKYRLQKHPDRALQISWNCAQIGVLIFPIIPILGALGLFLGLVGTGKQKFGQIIDRPINRGLLILTALLLITAVFARNKIEALLGLGNFLPFFLLFATFSRLIQTPAQLRHLSWLMVIGSIPVIILGLGQQFLGWNGIVQLQPIFGWVLEPQGNPPGRMASVFMYANILACYLTIVFILALGLCIEEHGKRGIVEAVPPCPPREGECGKTTDSPLPITNYQLPIINYQLPITNYRWLFLSLVVAGNAVCLIFTNSRNAWGIAVLATLAFAFYAGYKKILAAVFSAVGAVFLSAFGPEPLRHYLRGIIPAFFWARLTDEMFPDRPVATLRTTQWKFAWSMTQQRPLTGWGLRNFTPLYEAQMHQWLGHPHSLILMLTAEIGIPTTLFFIGLVGWILARGVWLLINWPPLSPANTALDGMLVRKTANGDLIADENLTFSSTNVGISQEVEGGDRLIFFSYLLAFGSCTLFNTVDVTLFDFRVNAISWILLAAIC